MQFFAVGAPRQVRPATLPPRLTAAQAQGFLTSVPDHGLVVAAQRGAAQSTSPPRAAAGQQNIGASAPLLRLAAQDPVSLTPMQTPYVLTDCGHSFARTTLLTLFASAPDGCRCPVCRTPVVSESRPNYALGEVLEALVAVGVLTPRDAFEPADASVLAAPKWAPATQTAYRARLLTLHLALRKKETHLRLAAVLVNSAFCFGLAEGRPHGNLICMALLAVALVTLPPVHWLACRRPPALPTTGAILSP